MSCEEILSCIPAFVLLIAPEDVSLEDRNDPTALKEGGCMQRTSSFNLKDVTDGVPIVSSSYEFMSMSVNTIKKESILRIGKKN